MPGSDGETMEAKDVQGLVAALERLAAALEARGAKQGAGVRWPDEEGLAYWYRRVGGRGVLQPVRRPHRLRLDDLKDIEPQKARVVRNTEQFLAGRPANNVLLTGARGTGKSSLVKALLTEYADRGLRLVEMEKADLVDLPDVLACLETRPERFIVFVDDLSFEEGEPAYKMLKSVLDGSVWAQPDNVLLYATSNRRHLMPEFFHENEGARHVGEEVHPAEAVEEKISLSERFGLWVSFYPFSQEEYLTIVAHWLRSFGAGEVEIEAARPEALQWAIERGSRSGRVAWQFARDWAGRHGLPRQDA